MRAAASGPQPRPTSRALPLPRAARSRRGVLGGGGEWSRRRAEAGTSQRENAGARTRGRGRWGRLLQRRSRGLSVHVSNGPQREGGEEDAEHREGGVFYQRSWRELIHLEHLPALRTYLPFPQELARG